MLWPNFPTNLDQTPNLSFLHFTICVKINAAATIFNQFGTNSIMIFNFIPILVSVSGFFNFYLKWVLWCHKMWKITQNLLFQMGEPPKNCPENFCFFLFFIKTNVVATIFHQFGWNSKLKHFSIWHLWSVLFAIFPI